MKRKEFKETLFETLNNVVDGMSYDDKMILVHGIYIRIITEAKCFC